jgi:hypothetical protein
MKGVICIGGFRTEPTAEHECREAVWTQGNACKSCEVKCYRAGWNKEQVTADNKKRVAERRRSQ